MYRKQGDRWRYKWLRGECIGYWPAEQGEETTSEHACGPDEDDSEFFDEVSVVYADFPVEASQYAITSAVAAWEVAPEYVEVRHIVDESIVTRLEKREALLGSEIAPGDDQCCEWWIWLGGGSDCCSWWV